MRKMTVMDAVKHYDFVWPVSQAKEVDDAIYYPSERNKLATNFSTGRRKAADDNENWYRVCTKDEFESYVQDWITGLQENQPEKPQDLYNIVVYKDDGTYEMVSGNDPKVANLLIRFYKELV